MKNKGLHINRLTKEADNPREVAFAEEWEKENLEQFGARPTLNHLLQNESLTSRDIQVAATVVQWLGSNVGMSFLRNALGRVGMEITEKKS